VRAGRLMAAKSVASLMFNGLQRMMEVMVAWDGL
jgi:hypothetical protein